VQSYRGGSGQASVFLLRSAIDKNILGKTRLVRVLAFPHPPRFSVRSSLPCSARAHERVYIPELYVGGHILHANFSLHLGSYLAKPHDSELSLRALVLQIDNAAGLQLGAHALQRRATTADVAQAGGLGERTGIGVHAPDLHGEFNENALLAATVHDADASLSKDFRDGKGKSSEGTGNLRYRHGGAGSSRKDLSVRQGVTWKISCLRMQRPDSVHVAKGARAGAAGVAAGSAGAAWGR